MSAAIIAIKDLKVDADGFKRAMKEFAHAMGRLGSSVVKGQAAALAADLLNFTLPVEGNGGPGKGVTTAARDIGIGTLERDVQSIFKPLHKASYEDIASQDSYSVFVAWAEDRWKHHKRTKGVGRQDINTEGWAQFKTTYGGGAKPENDFSGVNKGETFIRTTHVGIRGGSDVMNYSWNVKKNKKTFFIDNAEAKIPAYIKEASKRVGRLKSGWLEAARALGRKPRVAKWIVQNQHGSGYAVDQATGNTPTVIVANRIHFLMGRGAGTTLWKSAFHYRAYAMRASVAARVNKIAGGSPQRLEEVIRKLDLEAQSYKVEEMP